MRTICSYKRTEYYSTNLPSAIRVSSLPFRCIIVAYSSTSLYTKLKLCTIPPPPPPPFRSPSQDIDTTSTPALYVIIKYANKFPVCIGTYLSR